eukprot:377650_1
MYLLFLALTHLSGSIAFDADDLADFREYIIDEIKSRQSGLTINHPLVSSFDGLIPVDQPLIAALVRLAFHDCSGINPTKGFWFSKSNKFNQYICDGCIERNAPDNAGLVEGAIEPIQPICDIFKDVGLSTADCWMLAATIAIELSANNTLTSFARGVFGFNPTTVDLLPGDIPYLIGRKDCPTSPFTPDNFEFHPFKTTDGWDITSQQMKERFGLTNNQEVVALIGGGHSIGRGHSKISGFSQAWDISPNTIDNDYFMTLINREPVADFLGLNLDWFQARIVDDDTYDYLVENNGYKTHKQFVVNIPDNLRIPNGPFSSMRMFLYFIPDVSMAFDMRKYLSGDLETEITCHTDAYSICGDKNVMIDGFEIDGYNMDNICEYKQCPFQCQDGKGGVERFADILMNDPDLKNIDPDTDCIRALFEIFANDNVFFLKVFKKAFVKMITTGYKNGKSETHKLDYIL